MPLHSSPHRLLIGNHSKICSLVAGGPGSLIVDLNVDLLIEHPNRDDLHVILTHKQSGQSAMLANWPGNPGDQNIGDPATGQNREVRMSTFPNSEGADMFGVSGEMPATYQNGYDYYALKVTDLSGRIWVNGPDMNDDDRDTAIV